MDKFYRVKKDNFLWKEGAILKLQGNGYRAIEDIWNSTPQIGEEYISTRVIECPTNVEYFERVYPDTITGRVFKTKDQLIEIYKSSFVI